MSRKVFLNSDYLDENEAKISIFDRGVLFSDSVYEVTAFINDKLLDFRSHLTRLQRSLDELNINYKVSNLTILDIHKKLIKANKLNKKEGLIYLQISRGNMERDFEIPKSKHKINIFAFTQEKSITNNPKLSKGLKIITEEDLRWKRRDIKTTQLIYPSLLKTKATEGGADDAWMIDNKGYITEGTSNNAYIVSKNTIITRNLSNDILHGITRKTVLEVAYKLKLNIEERPFSVKEALNAEEAFITSASTMVAPVIQIDKKTVGDGLVGPITKILKETYLKISLKTAS